MLNIPEVEPELPLLWRLFFVNKKSQLLGIAGKIHFRKSMLGLELLVKCHPYELCYELSVFAEFAQRELNPLMHS